MTLVVNVLVFNQLTRLIQHRILQLLDSLWTLKIFAAFEDYLFPRKSDLTIFAQLVNVIIFLLIIVYI